MNHDRDDSSFVKMLSLESPVRDNVDDAPILLEHHLHYPRVPHPHYSDRAFELASQMNPHVPMQFDDAMRDMLPPTRRWSCDGSPNVSAELPASYYHNLGLLVHNHMHMSNRQLTDFDCAVAASAAVSASAPASTPSESGSNCDNRSNMAPNEIGRTNRETMDLRQLPHPLHHHPYRDPAMFENDFFGDNGRSVSAPNVAVPGAGCANNGNPQNEAGNGNMNGGHEFGARRRFRTNFTEHQSLYLENTFRDTHYPDHKQKKDMAAYLNIPEDRITVWFQNRRAKWRRKEIKERSRNDAYATSFDYPSFPGSIDNPQIPAPQMPLMNPFAEHQDLTNFELKSPDNSLFNHPVPTNHSQ